MFLRRHIFTLACFLFGLQVCSFAMEKEEQVALSDSREVGFTLQTLVNQSEGKAFLCATVPIMRKHDLTFTGKSNTLYNYLHKPQTTIFTEGLSKFHPIGLLALQTVADGWYHQPPSFPAVHEPGLQGHMEKSTRYSHLAWMRLELLSLAFELASILPPEELAKFWFDLAHETQFGQTNTGNGHPSYTTPNPTNSPELKSTSREVYFTIALTYTYFKDTPFMDELHDFAHTRPFKEHEMHFAFDQEYSSSRPENSSIDALIAGQDNFISSTAETDEALTIKKYFTPD